MSDGIDPSNYGPKCNNSDECKAWNADSVCGYIETKLFGASVKSDTQCIPNSECGKGGFVFDSGVKVQCPSSPLVLIIVIVVILLAICACIYCCWRAKKNSGTNVVVVGGAGAGTVVTN